MEGQPQPDKESERELTIKNDAKRANKRKHKEKDKEKEKEKEPPELVPVRSVFQKNIRLNTKVRFLVSTKFFEKLKATSPDEGLKVLIKLMKAEPEASVYEFFSNNFLANKDELILKA